MFWLWAVVALLLLLGLGFVIWRWGTRIVVTEERGELVARRRLAFSAKLLVAVAGIVLVLIVFFSSVKVVPVGHAMIKFNVLSKSYEVSGEGITVLPPFIYSTYIYDLRRQEYTMSTPEKKAGKPNVDETLWAPTKEGLQVGIQLTVWYRIEPDSLISLHRKIGPTYAERVVKPEVRSTARHIVAQYGVMEVYSTKRMDIERQIEEELRRSLAPDGIVVEGVALRDIEFTADFAKAIEEKQIAEQEAERMQYVLEKERMEAERKRIEAQGKAEAIRIVSQELRNNPEYTTYLYVEKLSDKVQVIVADPKTMLDLGNVIKR